MKCERNNEKEATIGGSEFLLRIQRELVVSKAKKDFVSNKTAEGMVFMK